MRNLWHIYIIYIYIYIVTIWHTVYHFLFSLSTYRTSAGSGKPKVSVSVFSLPISHAPWNPFCSKVLWKCHQEWYTVQLTLLLLQSWLLPPICDQINKINFVANTKAADSYLWVSNLLQDWKMCLEDNKMKPTNPNADTYVDKQRQYLFVTFPANSLVRHPDFTHWGGTLVGHPCLTLLRNVLVRHSCLTLLWDTLVRHFLLDTLVRHFLLDTLVRHSYLTFL